MWVRTNHMVIKVSVMLRPAAIVDKRPFSKEMPTGRYTIRVSGGILDTYLIFKNEKDANSAYAAFTTAILKEEKVIYIDDE